MVEIDATPVRGPAFRRHPERRELMIERALELFFERGYEAARIEDVARLSGVGKSAVLYHFGSKLGLAASVVTRHCLPQDPAGAGTVADVIDASLADPAAIKVLRLVMREQHRLPSLGRLYVAAILRRVEDWQRAGRVEGGREDVANAFGRMAARVLQEGYGALETTHD